MAGRIFRQVLPDAVKIVAPSADESFELAGDQRQHFEKLVSRFHGRVYQNLPRKRHTASLGQKSERKTGGQTKAVLLVAPPAREAQFRLGGEFSPSGKVGEISGFGENAFRGGHVALGQAAQPKVPHGYPLSIVGPSRRESKGRRLPSPALRNLVVPKRDHADGERRQPTPAVPH